ncbi:hypothetical protein L7F22_048988 [Adiantum nelumboides]|nr:hypothetical protein [Adiantum nelumboides]
MPHQKQASQWIAAPYEVDKLSTNEKAHMSEDILAQIPAHIFIAKFKDAEVTTSRPLWEIWTLHCNLEVMNAMHAIHLEGLFRLPQWGMDYMRAHELMSSIQYDGQAMLTNRAGIKNKVSITKYIINEVLHFYPGYQNLLQKTKSMDNEKAFIKAKGNKYKYSDMLYNELELPLRLISQHIRVQKPPRYTEPILHIPVVVMALAMAKNKTIKCDYGSFILENLIELNLKGSAKNKLYISARPMLTKIAYHVLGIIEDLPATNSQAALIQKARLVAHPVRTTTTATSSRATRSSKKSFGDDERIDTDKEDNSKGSNEESQKGSQEKGPFKFEKSDKEDTSTPLKRRETRSSKKPRWRMDTGKTKRRKEKPVGHRSGTPDGHYKKDRGPDLKIACPIFKGKKHDDPDVHIQAFEKYAELKHKMEEEWGKYFPHTLKEVARKWYYHYSASKLLVYKKLKKAFILEYTDDRGDEDILCELDRIKQGKLKLRDQEVPAPTKKFTLLVHRALKLEQQAKKEKSRHRGRSDTRASETTEIEQSNSSHSKSSKDDRKEKKKGSWSKKIDDMSRRIFEIFGLRGSIGRTEKWCTKCKAKNHTIEECTQCNYCKAFGHEWTNCKSRIHHLKEGKDLSMIAFANMEPVVAIADQAQSVNTNTSGYNGRGKGRGRGEPDKPVVTEVKQPEPIPVRAITRSSGVVIEELPIDEPTSSKLNPKAKEWEQYRSTWKEKGKAKEFDEWKEQREVAAKITKILSKRKPEIPKCFEARTVHKTLVSIAKALLLETQTVDTGSIAIDSSDDNGDFEKEQDEIEVQMCQRIQHLTIELEDTSGKVYQ